MTQPPHDSRALANQILLQARKQNVSLTIMQLLKLMFFAHGWHLALHDRPLSRDPVEAWQYGPVFPLVYKAAQGQGGVRLAAPLRDKSGQIELIEEFTPAEQNLIDEIIEGYGHMHAFDLSALTHEKGTPWDMTVQEKGVYSVIPDGVIRDYFQRIGRETRHGG